MSHESADERERMLLSATSVLALLLAGSAIVIAVLSAIAATIDRHAQLVELKREVDRLRSARKRPTGC
ncbi:MAG: hypothetical protein SGJ09_16695 [Phycisphaerae bacterium]|nr:hypothetical protein [Phycisphaerae bacterium]